MENFKISNEVLSSSLYFSDNRKEVKIHFWPNWSESAYLVFNTEDIDNVHPIRIEARTVRNNVGVKINIEVVLNGYIVKSEKGLEVCSTEYEMKDILNRIVITETDYSFKHLEDEHSFTNLEDTISLIKSGFDS